MWTITRRVSFSAQPFKTSNQKYAKIRPVCHPFLCLVIYCITHLPEKLHFIFMSYLYTFWIPGMCLITRLNSKIPEPINRLTKQQIHPTLAPVTFLYAVDPKNKHQTWLKLNLFSSTLLPQSKEKCWMSQQPLWKTDQSRPSLIISQAGINLCVIYGKMQSVCLFSSIVTVRMWLISIRNMILYFSST